MEIVREWLTALTTPTVAALGLWIAYHQLRVQRYRFRHDLSERRLSVLSAVRDLLESALTTLRPPIEALDRFDLARASAPFLFGRDVNEYLERLQKNYLAIWETSEQQAEEQFADEKEEHANLKRRRELRKWMREQLPEVQKVFKKYLDLSTA